MGDLGRGDVYLELSSIAFAIKIELATEDAYRTAGGDFEDAIVSDVDVVRVRVALRYGNDNHFAVTKVRELYI